MNWGMEDGDREGGSVEKATIDLTVCDDTRSYGWHDSALNVPA